MSQNIITQYYKADRNRVCSHCKSIIPDRTEFCKLYKDDHWRTLCLSCDNVREMQRHLSSNSIDNARELH